MPGSTSDPLRRSVRFGDLEIAYDDRVLSPRPWTTAQSRWMAEVLHRLPQGPILELCSGAGHIGLLAAAYTGRDIVLVDASTAACELAEDNVAANPVSGSVEVRPARIDEAVAPHERFVGILADPPWVPSDRTPVFPDDPLSAIDGGPDGLDVARVCVRVAAAHLLPDGSVLLQLGTREQAAALGEELDGLTVAEVRSGEGGVVVHLRATTGPDEGART